MGLIQTASQLRRQPVHPDRINPRFAHPLMTVWVPSFGSKGLGGAVNDLTISSHVSRLKTSQGNEWVFTGTDFNTGITAGTGNAWFMVLGSTTLNIGVNNAALIGVQNNGLRITTGQYPELRVAHTTHITGSQIQAGQTLFAGFNNMAYTLSQKNRMSPSISWQTSSANFGAITPSVLLEARYLSIALLVRFKYMPPRALVEALHRNPWSLFDRPKRATFFSAASTPIELDGAATASATAAADLSTQIPLTGAAAVIGTASGAISTAIPLSGQAASVSLADGVLTTQITLSGTALAQAMAAAGLTTGIPLAGQAAGQATATGDLSTGSSLSGAAAAEALAQASLTTQIRLSGAALAEALAGGDLTAPGAGLSGAATAQAGASGTLYTAIPLTGAAQAYSTASGGLTTIIPLAGAAASVSAATGDLTLESTLTGAALATALAGGDLTTVIRLEGAAVAQAVAAGSLGVALAVPAHLPHLVEAANGAWEVEAYSSTWEVAA